MLKMRIALVFGACGALALPSGPVVQADDDHAWTLLSEMHNRYARLDSYVDRGEITITIETPEETMRRHTSFVTAFQSPDQMRSQMWYSPMEGAPEQQSVLWLDGPSAHLWTLVDSSDDAGDLQTFDSYEAALLEAARHGSARFNAASRFLVAQQGLMLVFNLRTARIEGELDIDGVTCWFISGTLENEATARIVVGKDDLLMRRLEFRTKPYKRLSRGISLDGPAHEVEEFWPAETVVHTVVVYEPEANVSIAPEALTFTPPSDARVAGAWR